MLEPLSAAYYLGRVTVEAHDGDHAAMATAAHREAAAAVYGTGEGVERVDHPLVVKLEGLHLPVFGEAGLPTGTLAVPDGVLAATGLPDPPTATEILVARAERAARLLAWFTPYEPTQPAYT